MRTSLNKLTVVLVALVALVAAGCSSGDGGGGGGGEQAAGAPASVDVTLTEFSIAPSTLDVPTGAAITFNVLNHGTVPHTFAVDVNGKTYDSGQIEGGASGTLAVPALVAGTYPAYCSIPGHKDLGMTASVVASDAAVGGATSVDASSDMGGMSSSTMSAQQMAEMHEAGVTAFLAGKETTTVGGQPLEPTMDGHVKVFNLTVSQINWEVSKGVFKDAMAFNGMVPGPEIHVSYGDHVRFVVQNQMDQPFVMHFHGMTVPNAMDGVPYVTQDPIMPGQYWTYEFTVKDPPGMYVYHSHFNSTEQVGSGLYGAIIIDPQGGRWPYPAANINARTGFLSYGASPRIDDVYTMFLGDGPLGYVLNGKSFPATAPLGAKTGDWVLLHLANDGSLLHPMHLHGYHFEVVSQDGFPLRDPYMADTLVIAPGQRYDVLIHAVYPGAWAFHCHILPHVEGPQGMYGMVTVLVVQ
jgi:uncharacterized cupredoxin-like copper-binding protein